MVILGFHGGEKFPCDDDLSYTHGHDAGAALVVDGHIITAVGEERFNRIKHTNCFPASSINFCLESNRLTLDNVDLIVRSCSEDQLTAYLKFCGIADCFSPVAITAKSDTTALLRKVFHTDVGDRLLFCDHHDAHSWSAFGPSNFKKAIVMSSDGHGDGRSGSISIGEAGEIRKLRDLSTEQSLGNLYSHLIHLIGFGDFEEFKAMGLAPYGTAARLQSHFAMGRKLLPDGYYELASLAEWGQLFSKLDWIDNARRRGGEFTQEHINIAASVQYLLEELAFHVLTHFRETTGIASLCMAGGVALNCTLNGKILNSGLFEEVYVQPASDDSGLALGAALWAHHRANTDNVPKRIVQPIFLGTELDLGETVLETLRGWNAAITFEEAPDICQSAASLLAEGAVIGWVQGRAEYGPRALGNRSILADPRPSSNKERINKMVKKREEFRPFAPSVISEAVSEFFEVPQCRTDYGHMTFSLKVREEKRELLGAVTHVDGSARLQSVGRSTNLMYWKLLHEFGLKTGIPILLNTSFNNDVEPIVDSIADALSCFLTTGLDYLVIDRYVIRRKLQKPTAGQFLDWQVALQPHIRLIGNSCANDGRYKLESSKWVAFRRASLSLSREAFRALSECKRGTTLRTVLGNNFDIDAELLFEELWMLWERRLIQMKPSIEGEA
jgi:carbamoyltransferase